ncbi:MAG: hypothetical protein FWE27_05475 [Defluviitaleaceae bacterium]|nr:hypothetical protein [Defluviitaleaceae bacterium]
MQKHTKRIIALALAFLMALSSFPVTAVTEAYDDDANASLYYLGLPPAETTSLAAVEILSTLPGIVISQMYGRTFTADDTPAVSRGFIEIYNPTNNPVDLTGLSLQVQNVSNSNNQQHEVFKWDVLEFEEELDPEKLIMQPRTSLLIVTKQSDAEGARYEILNFDAEMDIEFSNRNFSAAIVNNTTQLSNKITEDEMADVIDLVGAWNNNNGTRDRVENFRGGTPAGPNVGPAHRISNQESVRRVWDNVEGSFVIRNTPHNALDFTSARYVLDDTGMCDNWLEINRPRYSGDGEWTWAPLLTHTVTARVMGAAGATTSITPTGAQPANTPMTLTLTAPPDQRFMAEAGAPVSVTGSADFDLTVAANRRTATGTFPMPAGGGELVIDPDFEDIPPDTRPIIASLVREEVNARAVNHETPANSHFVGTGGVFGSSFRLTAWDNNTQVLIGFAGTNRTPVVFNNGSLVTTPTRWRPAREEGVGLVNAPAFQMSFPTTGHSDITFTARQKSTASGPDAFFLAYRIGSTGNWIPIDDSRRNVRRIGDDTYGALNHTDAATYVNFPLPSAADNKELVYLRVIFDGMDNLTSGNASINNIEIRGTAPGYEVEVIGGGGASSNPQYAEANTNVRLFAGAAPTGQVFSHWTAIEPYDLDINNETSATAANFTMPDGPVTVIANFVSFSPNMMNQKNLVINQLYGQGSVDENGVSHGFIELYNPTDVPISLEGMSVQLQNPGDPGSGNALPATIPTWEALELPNITMEPQTSFLIVSTTWINDGKGGSNVPEAVRDHEPSLIIENYDLAWNLEFGNRTMTVALVEGTATLSPIIALSEWANVIDLVGAENTGPPRDRADNFLGARIRPGMTRQRTIRRVWDGGVIQNTHDNAEDFAQVRVNDLSAADLAAVEPRYSGDGPWNMSMFEVTVTAQNNVTTSISPAGPRQVGTTMTLTIAAPFGQRFAAGETPITIIGVTVTDLTVASNRLTATATFTMPQGGAEISVSANLETIPVPDNGILINQMYGRAMSNNQSVSRGFIELYNQNDTPFNLSGFSLQVQNISDGPVGQPNTVSPWRVLDFDAVLDSDKITMPPRTSLLIVTEQSNEVGARYIIPNYDATMNMVFSNRNFSAAIVAGTVPLSNKIDGAEMPFVIDLVGAWNEANGPRDHVENFWGSGPAHRISNQQAVRRTWYIEADSYVISSASCNLETFTTIRYASPEGDDPGISDEMFELVRPRYSGDGEWTGPMLYAVSATVTGGATAVIIPSGMQLADAPMTLTVTAPASQRFALDAGETITVALWNYPEFTFDLIVSADRRTAAGNFQVPPDHFNYHIIAEFEPIPGFRPVLVSLTRTEVNATAINNNNPANSHFVGTGGIFADNFRLTAWENNTQRLIGHDDTNRTPVVFNNGFGTDNTLWSNEDGTPRSTKWNPASEVGLENAPAFQMRFPTTGYENITFTARQKSTGSGPDTFFLAYRIGSSGEWIPIANSTREVRRVTDNTYAAFNNLSSNTYNSFILPAAINNQDAVYLRVVFDGLDDLDSGNTSINDIVIRGNVIGEPVRSPGDVLGTGRVTSTDTTAIARWIISSPTQRQEMIANGFCEYAANITGTGSVGVYDLTIFSRWLVGLDVSKYINSDGTRVTPS